MLKGDAAGPGAVGRGLTGNAARANTVRLLD